MNITITYVTSAVAINVASVADALACLGVLAGDVRMITTPCQHEGCTAIINAGLPAGAGVTPTWLCHDHTPRYRCAHPRCRKFGRDPGYLCVTHKYGQRIP